jgi:hypothetical protein
MEKNFNHSHVDLLNQESLHRLEIPEHDTKKLISSFNDFTKFDKAKERLLDKISTVSPKVKTNKSLKSLFTYRVKFLAHQE